MRLTRLGNVLKPGTVVLATMQFTDTFETKLRPAVVLFAEHGNIVVAGVTSNTKMEGIALTLAEGAIKPSVIKLNYIFTISAAMIQKPLFSLTAQKHKLLVSELVKRLQS